MKPVAIWRLNINLARYHLHLRERGLPAWVDAVDDKKQIVTLTFFDGLDPALLDDFDNHQSRTTRMACSAPSGKGVERTT